MKIHIRLHGILRDWLPPEARGQATWEFAEGASVADLLVVLDELGIRRRFNVARNGSTVNSESEPLEDGDEIDVFRSIAGGCPQP